MLWSIALTPMLPAKVPVTAPYLVEIPSTTTQEEAKKILQVQANSSIRSKVFFYETMVDKYEHPFFMLHLADMLFILKSPTMAMQLCVRAQQLARNTGVIDSQLDKFIEKEAAIVTEDVEKLRLNAEKDSYYQIWKPTRQHKFPFNLPVPPDGYIELRNDWAKLQSSGDLLFDQYLLKLSIETNRLEIAFLLTESSTQDLIHKGIDAGVVDCLPHSALHDPDIIKSILKDTLAAYRQLGDITDDTKKLTRENICRIHKYLMWNSRVTSDSDFYITPGSTRSSTRKTVVISGVTKIQCCPYPAVDNELDYICRMAVQYINNWSNRNPFGVASWLHLAIARCHPFEDGNGRLARLLASIPLIREKYPPVYIAMYQKAEYYHAIRMASEGDHQLFAKCLLGGMREAINSLSTSI